MNRYFNPAVRRGKSEHAKNVLLGTVRSAILRNKSLAIGTAPEKIDYWCDLIREEFPEVSIRVDKYGIYVNERKS